MNISEICIQFAFLYFLLFLRGIGEAGSWRREAGLICQFYIVHPREICVCCIKITSYIVRERTLMAVWHQRRAGQNTSSASECVALFLAFLKMLQRCVGTHWCGCCDNKRAETCCPLFCFIFYSSRFQCYAEWRAMTSLQLLSRHCGQSEMSASHNLRGKCGVARETEDDFIARQPPRVTTLWIVFRFLLLAFIWGKRVDS